MILMPENTVKRLEEMPEYCFVKDCCQIWAPGQWSRQEKSLFCRFQRLSETSDHTFPFYAVRAGLVHGFAHITASALCLLLFPVHSLSFYIRTARRLFQLLFHLRA